MNKPPSVSNPAIKDSTPGVGPYLTTPQEIERVRPRHSVYRRNEAAERFSFYGMKAILAVFMTQHLLDDTGENAPMSDAECELGSYVRRCSLCVSRFGRHRCRLAAGRIPHDHRPLGRLLLWASCFALDERRFGLAIGLSLIAIGTEQSSRAFRRTSAISLVLAMLT